MRQRTPNNANFYSTVVGTTLIVSAIFLLIDKYKNQLSLKEEDSKSSKTDSSKESKPQKSNSANATTKQQPGHKQTVGILDDNPSSPDFIMEEIGLIRSNFPHRAGTPRQGTLAPHARSQLILHSTVAPGALEDLDKFSHLWVIFRFHINVDSEKKTKKSPLITQGAQGTRYSAKVKPPRAGGKKVGVFATRAPHRPNNVGLSLCQIESIDLKTRTLHLLGLDLVDYTPVYDIKPYIPWDNVDNSPSSTSPLRVPEWVTQDEKIANVSWTRGAVAAVTAARLKGALSPLFPPLNNRKKKKNKKKGNDNQDGMQSETPSIEEIPTTDDDKDSLVSHESLCEVCLAVSEVIAQDPRALHHGRGDQTQNGFDYSMTFNTLRVAFKVIDGKTQSIDSTNDNNKETSKSTDSSSQSSHAIVVAVEEDPGDITASPGSYQHSMALRRQAEDDALRKGVRKLPLPWQYPIREGFVKDLYLLRGGEVYSVHESE